jgi:hypothetical protein
MERHSFALEHLEDRALFSAVAPLDAAPMTAAKALVPTHYSPAAVLSPFPLAFNVGGTFTHPIGPIGNPDTGSQYQFTGTGKTTTLGGFVLTGQVQSPGFVASGRTRGELVIRNSHGTITLHVVGPLQSPGSLPSSFSFSIVKGTGAFVHSSGNGKILLATSGTTHKFLFRFRPAS